MHLERFIPVTSFLNADELRQLYTWKKLVGKVDIDIADSSYKTWRKDKCGTSGYNVVALEDVNKMARV